MRTAFLTLLFVVVLAAPAGAEDYEVNLTHDDGNGNCLDGGCTLREAVTQAGGDDRVLLPSDHDYELSQGELVLAGDTIVGEDARDTTIVGTGDERVFNVASGTNRISGVIITNGFSGFGGGIFVALNATLILSESTVRDNASWQGGGIASNGTLTVVRSTLTDNAAGQPTDGSQGGAIFSAGTTTLVNSTVSGNRAASGESSDSTGAGIYVSSGAFTAESTTITGNTALADPQSGGQRDSAIHRETPGTATVTLSRTIVTGTSPIPFFGPCEGGPFAGQNNLFGHTSCGTPVADPLLGPLDMNGGTTSTHLLLAGSPAIDSGGAGCPGEDQRGFVRPVGTACDIGAVEVVADMADLRVVTQVVNDSGRTATAASFNVHVRRGGIDVAGSPAPGNAQGRDYVGLPVGDYTVTGAATSGYTAETGGACAAGGAITLGPGDEPECVVTFNDVAPSGGQQPPPPPPTDDDDLPAPEAGKTVNVLPEGKVKVKLPGRNRRFRALSEGEQLPVGTIVDTLNGRVTLVVAGGDTADFYGGIFRIGQGKGAKPLTTLTLVEKLSCPKAGSAIAAATKKKRRLWGDGNGKFRTKGKHSAATVVGTRWLVEDRCKSTLTRVVRGRVSVRDFVKKKTVIVRAGKRYVAKAKQR